jgi:hypothetical protein
LTAVGFELRVSCLCKLQDRYSTTWATLQVLFATSCFTFYCPISQLSLY